jgi:hypothetical protein
MKPIKSQTPSEAESLPEANGDLQFRGPFLEMFFDGAHLISICIGEHDEISVGVIAVFLSRLCFRSVS